MTEFLIAVIVFCAIVLPLEWLECWEEEHEDEI